MNVTPTEVLLALTLWTLAFGWLIQRYYARKGARDLEKRTKQITTETDKLREDAREQLRLTNIIIQLSEDRAKNLTVNRDENGKVLGVDLVIEGKTVHLLTKAAQAVIDFAPVAAGFL